MFASPSMQFTYSAPIPPQADAPRVVTVNPAVMPTSTTSLSDRFSQLYQKRRGNMVPQYQAQQTTARYSNAMSRRTGEFPTHQAQDEVYTSSFNARAAPFIPSNNQGAGGGGGGFHAPRGRGGFNPSYQHQQPDGDSQSFLSNSQPSGTRSWHVVRGGGLQPQGPGAMNRPTAPPMPRGGYRGRGGFAPLPPRGGRGRGRGRGGYGGGGFNKTSLDADLDEYMAAEKKPGMEGGTSRQDQLDADLEQWRKQGDVEAGAGASGGMQGGVDGDAVMA